MPRPVADILDEIAEYALANPFDTVVPADDPDRGEIGYKAKGGVWTLLIRDLNQFCLEGLDNRSIDVERCLKTSGGRQNLPKILADFARPVPVDSTPLYTITRFQLILEPAVPARDTLLSMAKFIRDNPDATIVSTDDSMRRSFRWLCVETKQVWDVSLTEMMNLDPALKVFFKDSNARRKIPELLRSFAVNLPEEGEEDQSAPFREHLGEIPVDPPPSPDRSRFELMDEDF